MDVQNESSQPNISQNPPKNVDKNDMNTIPVDINLKRDFQPNNLLKIEDQLKNIQKMMVPLITQQSSNKQHSNYSVGILERAIGRSIKVNCEQVIELLIDDLLTETVVLLNQVEGIRNQQHEKQKLMAVVSNFLETVNQYEKELTTKEILGDEFKQQKIDQESIMVNCQIDEKNLNLFLEIDEDLSKKINQNQEIQQNIAEKTNYCTKEYVQGTQKASEMILQELFDEVYSTMMQDQFHYVVELLRNELGDSQIKFQDSIIGLYKIFSFDQELNHF